VQDYLAFFGDIPVGRRVLLVENNEGIEILDWLRNSDHFDRFAERFAPMKNLRLPEDGLDAFRTFLDQTWPAYRAELVSVQNGYAGTVEAIADSGDSTLQQRLRRAVEEDSLAAYLEEMESLGYHVDPEQIPFIEEGIRFQAERDWAVAQLKKAPIRTGWNRRFQEKFSVTEALESIADNPGRAEWIASQLAEADAEAANGEGDGGGGGLSADYDSQRLVRIATDIRNWNDLVASEQVLVARYGGSEGFSKKTWWLIIVSATVCVVGIANAMLMSVLERFKEIATMKCLGARNSTIAFLFVMESIIIGAIGGIVGMVGGFLIVFVRQAIGYGGLLFEQFPVYDMLLTTLICFCCSLLLTAVAAIYPARVASQMAPMEAMRID
jgi:putative ABC transport system permease protein